MNPTGIPEGVAMKISSHKTRSVFERYNIVNDADLQLAAQRQEAYLQTQKDTISSTIGDFQQKKGHGNNRNPLKSLVPPAGIEPAAHGLGIQCSIH